MLIGNTFSPTESLSLAMSIRSDREMVGIDLCIFVYHLLKGSLVGGYKQLGPPIPRGIPPLSLTSKAHHGSKSGQGGPKQKVGSSLELHPRTGPRKW